MTYTLAWDWKSQPDLDRLGEILAHFGVHLEQVDTGGDDYEIRISATPADTDRPDLDAEVRRLTAELERTRADLALARGHVDTYRRGWRELHHEVRRLDRKLEAARSDTTERDRYRAAWTSARRRAASWRDTARTHIDANLTNTKQRADASDVEAAVDAVLADWLHRYDRGEAGYEPDPSHRDLVRGALVIAYPYLTGQATGDRAQLLAQLSTLISDLQGHIEDRAHEIAAPRIEAAEADAAARVAEIEREAAAHSQRQGDLIEELRRQLGSAAKYNDQLIDENKRLAQRAGDDTPESTEAPARPRGISVQQFADAMLGHDVDHSTEPMHAEADPDTGDPATGLTVCGLGTWTRPATTTARDVTCPDCLRDLPAEEPPPAPCPVCGRAPADQEYGPDGRCRHTTATRVHRTDRIAEPDTAPSVVWHTPAVPDDPEMGPRVPHEPDEDAR